VLIVGAGPVGAVLALELARQHVRSILIDRSVTVSRHPKMDFLNGRSMELLRRLGLTAEIRARGVPAQHAFNFIWSRDFGEPPVAVWNYPSAAEMSRIASDVNDGSAPVEPHQRLQGSLLEEILRNRVRAAPEIDFRAGWALADLTPSGPGVTALIADPASGAQRRIRARFVVGCDGANSTVRRLLGITVDDIATPTRHRDVYFRSGDPVLRRHGRAFLTIAAGGLTLVSRDEGELWTGTVHLADDAMAAQDPVELMRRNLGAAFGVDEILNIAEWEGHLAVSHRYRAGPVFLAGDAAHHFYPIGGHGANTGIGDAVDLAWKLAAELDGWAGPGLLASYEAERRPVALFNREMCANLLEVWLRFPRLAASGASREHLAGFLAREAYQTSNLGVHFDYRYDGSPVIWPGEGPAPRWRWDRINQVTWPGGRAPAVRLADGEQVLDRLGAAGPGFTLVDTSGGNAGKDMATALAGLGVPVTYLPTDDERLASVWDKRLVLVRPDQHVAWRGDDVPAGIDAVLARVTGRETS
jgi:2-polyprenyl-6-methoxyphenol hydroxylase-like FAD-dependent oxidoreductase